MSGNKHVRIAEGTICHQSPLHDSSEAKPGMDSLAPEDGSHRPAAEPTPPGAQPTAPG
ncbi:hypothetical protein QUG18_26520, partial [Escherichia coli]|uniref:hypothetical protein n=1 Tax=Escherichia coli TaxID=562 RepID=UPI0025A0D09E